MSYADCWTDELAARYSPLRQIKRRVGKVASKTQLKTIIATAMGNQFWQVAMYCGAVAQTVTIITELPVFIAVGAIPVS